MTTKQFFRAICRFTFAYQCTRQSSQQRTETRDVAKIIKSKKSNGSCELRVDFRVLETVHVQIDYPGCRQDEQEFHDPTFRCTNIAQICHHMSYRFVNENQMRSHNYVMEMEQRKKSLLGQFHSTGWLPNRCIPRCEREPSI
ncbi:hypothetical protein KIN20_013914 [Parelaphostrongylus tenuis]|uniref:Uncharacterized protein n=1 Tax=Parelaphostrongylus tenuis TaxID=148309 RepID=A0AAD5MYS5_PARTN|nr:hypothetical protein KIN20_013914 [Parelaphostrongylus tenuis]